VQKIINIARFFRELFKNNKSTWRAQTSAMAADPEKFLLLALYPKMVKIL